MKTAEQWFNQYAESHQNKTNKLIHWICVPSIFFSIYLLFRSIPFEVSTDYPEIINLANIILASSILFYFSISWRIAIGMSLFAFLISIFGSYFMSLVPHATIAALLIFIAAWIGQFIGHHIEGKKPSFLTDLQFLLIGPAWLMSFIYKSLGLSY